MPENHDADIEGDAEPVAWRYRRIGEPASKWLLSYRDPSGYGFEAQPLYAAPGAGEAGALRTWEDCEHNGCGDHAFPKGHAKEYLTIICEECVARFHAALAPGAGEPVGRAEEQALRERAADSNETFTAAEINYVLGILEDERRYRAVPEKPDA